jgi:hypothetical protein
MLYHKAETYERYSGYPGVFYNGRTRARPIQINEQADALKDRKQRRDHTLSYRC